MVQTFELIELVCNVISNNKFNFSVQFCLSALTKPLDSLQSRSYNGDTDGQE